MAILDDIGIDYVNKILKYTGGGNVDADASGGDSSTILIDGTADFGVTEDVIAGDIVINVDDGSMCEVVTVDSVTTLTCTALTGGTDNLFQSGDNITIVRIYSSNALYSYCQDTFDELTQMDDDVPMSAQTPTSYTMVNGWYLEEELTKYLKGGAIQTGGYTGVIQSQLCTADPGCVPTDVGKLVDGSTTGAGFGTLVDYDNTAKMMWIRSATTTTDTETIDVPTGTGSGTASGASASGENVFANPYTLGTLETVNGAPQLYIFQDGEILANPYWFGTGHFDILVKVQEAGTNINARKITVFDRNWLDLGTHFEITLTTAGQNAVPMSNGNDLNVTDTEATVQAIADTNIGGDLGTGIDIVVSLAGYSYDIGDGNGNQTYDVEIDCNGVSLADVYQVTRWATREGATTELDTGVQGQEYVSANPGTYGEIPAAAFGTFAGGKFFGAQGVYFINLHADDIQNFQLIDAAGTTRYPPNKQPFTFASIASGDRVAIYLDTGQDNGVVDKTQFTSHTTNNDTGNTTFEVDAAIPSDTPPVGTIFIVSADGTEEERTYASWTGAIFTLDSAHAGGYDGTTTAYVPYLYLTSSGTSASELDCIYVSPRYCVARMRKAGYIPFQTTGQYTSTAGYIATAVRNVDPIYT